MTLAHRVQVVILGLLHLWIWLVIYRDVREWLRERAGEKECSHSNCAPSGRRYKEAGSNAR
jgi:hypothetical protein